jgi:hypothetical protein
VDQALDYVRARYLDVLRGRWLSHDPQPDHNLYWYAANRPTVLSDPTGEVVCEPPREQKCFILGLLGFLRYPKDYDDAVLWALTTLPGGWPWRPKISTNQALDWKVAWGGDTKTPNAQLRADLPVIVQRYPCWCIVASVEAEAKPTTS